ncbi:autotransporter assembly complex protein TamA [Enterovirga rhinocerotis]|uniref:Autotransporter secretion outer membrane protein TamA n=1 Tax=Enterovirga rhinocerotis TaxID=1339210 RepID=A0A4R7C938_9HYPH|nr:BamA/TamA family outer membrane protein [Enterovirga rhinocerotis]TDR93227.1 autotransporter secretion outer membrane protein TamA [Enterovirga rhinocerotis]
MRRVLRAGPKHLGLALLVTVSVVGGLNANRAFAFDFFGLFGDGIPEPSKGALPYEVSFETRGDDDLSSVIRQVSNLYSLRRDAPPDGVTLEARARGDYPAMIDALWSAGYYNAKVTILVAGRPLSLGQDLANGAARAAEAYRGRARVPVQVVADLGPLFRLRQIAVVNKATGRPFSEEEFPSRLLKLEPGDPARTPDMRAAIARITDWFRAQSYPLVRVLDPAPVVDHASQTVDIVFTVDTGRKAGIGAITMKRPQTFPQDVARSFIYLDYGEPYTPKKLNDMRKSVATIPAVGSVRVREGTALDSYGNLPVFVEVTDRSPNLVGFQVAHSTLDGPTGRVFYENRNLFGGAERLRLEGAAFFAPRIDGSRIRDPGDLKISDIGARFTVGFLKPAIGGSPFDFTLDGIVERNRVGSARFGGYTNRLAGGTVGFRYRWDETLFFTGGVKYEKGQTSDTISNVDYDLVGIPVGLKFDNTDSLLDPTTGFRVNANLATYPGFLGSSVGFTRGTADVSGYYALDEDKNYVLAGRVGVGSLLDGPSNLGEVPSNYRFYTGGGGSVRGYRYQTISPLSVYGTVVGGRSLFEANVEARIKVTDTIGIVPFFDVGAAYGGKVPDLTKGDPQMSAGVGLRYYTSIGPIRVDVAMPINKRRGDQPVVLYVSLGQAF